VKTIDKARKPPLAAMGMAGNNQIKRSRQIIVNLLRAMGQKDSVSLPPCTGNFGKLILSAIRVINPKHCNGLSLYSNTYTFAPQHMDAQGLDLLTDPLRFAAPPFMVAGNIAAGPS